MLKIKNYYTTICCLILSLPLVLGQSEIKDVTGQPIEWQTLSKPVYSIQYPSNWTLDTSHSMGIQFQMTSPLENSSDIFSENVNLVIQDLSGQMMNLDQFTELSEDQIKTYFPTAEITQSERIQSKFGDCHHLLYTATHGTFHLRFEQYYWIIEHEAYILTFTCEIQQFEKYEEIGEAMIQSFEIK